MAGGVGVTMPAATKPGGDLESEEATGPLMKLDLLSTPLPEIEALLVSWGQPGYRAKQVHEWVSKRGARTFEEMNNLPKALRSLLVEHCCVGSLSVAVEQVSNDGTRKRAYALKVRKGTTYQCARWASGVSRKRLCRFVLVPGGPARRVCPHALRRRAANGMH